MARKKKPKEDTNETPEKVKIERYSKDLPVLLTTEEVAERADRAAHLLAEHDEKIEEQKAAAKHAKSVTESLEAELRRLSNEVRTKKTYAQVECERRYEYGSGMLKEIRTDTGEVIFERPLTEAEKQLELPKPDGDLDEDFDDEAAQ